MGNGEGSTMRNFIVCTVHIFRVIESKGLRWAGHVVRMEEGTFKILRGKPAGKRSLGKPRHRWEDKLEWVLKK